jgi:hypothetical protein
MVVMIGIDPHKASHTAVAIDLAEVPLGQLRVRACAAQAERLLAWAQAWPQRTSAAPLTLKQRGIRSGRQVGRSLGCPCCARTA